MTPPAAVDEAVPQAAGTERTATRPAEPTSRTTVESLAPTATATCGPRRLRHHLALVASTGQRPDLALTRELRLDLDPWLESTRALGPLIDPNVHSCGTVPPHGYEELRHPEANYFAVGVKSYGRAPTFLMATGYEQVRSVTAALAGDVRAAASVDLTLPQTVCQSDAAAAGSGCCGGPAPASVEACCVKDADAKASGEAGCGCGAKPADPALAPAAAAPSAGACCGA